MYNVQRRSGLWSALYFVTLIVIAVFFSFVLFGVCLKTDRHASTAELHAVQSVCRNYHPGIRRQQEGGPGGPLPCLSCEHVLTQTAQTLDEGTEAPVSSSAPDAVDGSPPRNPQPSSAPSMRKSPTLNLSEQQPIRVEREDDAQSSAPSSSRVIASADLGRGRSPVSGSFSAGNVAQIILPNTPVQASEFAASPNLDGALYTPPESHLSGFGDDSPQTSGNISRNLSGNLSRNLSSSLTRVPVGFPILSPLLSGTLSALNHPTSLQDVSNPTPSSVEKGQSRLPLSPLNFAQLQNTNIFGNQILIVRQR